MFVVVRRLNRPGAAFYADAPAHGVAPSGQTEVETIVSRSPFIEDPRQKASEHIAKAVASPVEEVRAIHIRAAEQLTELAKANGLPPHNKMAVKATSQPKK